MIHCVAEDFQPLVAVFCVGGHGEHHGQTFLAEDAKEALSAGVGSMVSGVHYAVVEVVAVVAHMVDPSHEFAATVAADRMAFLVHVAPRHELLHVFNLDIVRIDDLYIAVEMSRKCAAVSIPWQTAFGLGEVGAFERSPKRQLCARVLLAAFFQVSYQRGEIECADVLGEVECIRMVGGVATDGVGIMVDAGNHLCAFLTADACSFNARGGATGTAEEVDIEEFNHVSWVALCHILLLNVSLTVRQDVCSVPMKYCTMFVSGEGKGNRSNFLKAA